MPKKENNLEVHTEAMSRFNSSMRTDSDQRALAIEDMRFAQVPGGQWDDIASAKRKNRPKYEINKIALAVNQVVGDQRQNRISMKIRPFQSGSTQEVANTYNGLIRNIENVSKFANAKDNAFFELVNGGFGAWYVKTEFNANDTFDQDIRLTTIRSAASSVFFDPAATDENKRDANYAFVAIDMSKDDFKSKYPKATVSDMPTNSTGGTQFAKGWRTEDTVRVADYWVKVPTTKKIVKLTDGRVVDFEQVEPVLDELAQEGIEIAVDQSGRPQERTIKTHKIVFYKISGAEILEGPSDWAGKFIPVVPIYGFNMWIEGTHYYRGMVRLAKDAQRVYNYVTSAKIEAAALAPKDPIFYTKDQIKGHTRAYETYNTSNTPFLPYNPDPKAPGPPQRLGAPQIQSALVEQGQQADVDIQATTGRFAPSLGDNPGQQSGRAILAVQREGDVGTFQLIDNLKKGVEYTGEILLDLIPKIYDTERQIRVLKEDGTDEMVTINQTVFDQQEGKKVILNDLSQGKYDVLADVGPSYNTQRVEALNFLSEISKSSPLFAQVSPDLLAKNIDFPFADELSKRIRAVLIPQGVIQPTEEEKKEIEANQPQQQPNPFEQLQLQLAEFEVQQKAGEVDKTEIEIAILRADLDKKRADIQKTLTDVLAGKAGISKTLADTAAQGGKPSFPIDDSEILAREQNMNLLNQSLEEGQLEGEEQLLQGDQELLPQEQVAEQIPEGFTPEIL